MLFDLLFHAFSRGKESNGNTIAWRLRAKLLIFFHKAE